MSDALELRLWLVAHQSTSALQARTGARRNMSSALSQRACHRRKGSGMTRLKSIAVSTAMMLAMGGLSPTQAQTHKPLFAEKWHDGVSATEPEMQVQRVDPN